MKKRKTLIVKTIDMLNFVSNYILKYDKLIQFHY